MALEAERPGMYQYPIQTYSREIPKRLSNNASYHKIELVYIRLRSEVAVIFYCEFEDYKVNANYWGWIERDY